MGFTPLSPPPAHASPAQDPVPGERGSAVGLHGGRRGPPPAPRGRARSEGPGGAAGAASAPLPPALGLRGSGGGCGEPPGTGGHGIGLPGCPGRGTRAHANTRALTRHAHGRASLKERVKSLAVAAEPVCPAGAEAVPIRAPSTRGRGLRPRHGDGTRRGWEGCLLPRVGPQRWWGRPGGCRWRRVRSRAGIKS